VKHLPFVFFAVSCVMSGCGDDTPVRFVEQDVPTTDVAVDVETDADTDVSTRIDVPPIPIDRVEPPGMVVVYAHSDSALFSVDPMTRSVRMIGMFMFPTDGNNHSMTDLAVNEAGSITGVTQDALYTIDPTTAGCTLIRSLPTTDRRIFVGLTWVPASVLDPRNEVLVGGATDGSLWRIDPATGRSTAVGNLPTGWGISGDIVSIRGAGTFATVRRTSGTSTADTLATLTWSGTSVRMNNVGEVRASASVGFQSIFGLGYWRTTLYGFTRAGKLITINSTTARATEISMPTMQFSGAGVTTVSPTAPP
jgi:hypothetical protein